MSGDWSKAANVRSSDLVVALHYDCSPACCRFDQLAAAAGAGSPGELVLQMAEECLRVLVGVSAVLPALVSVFREIAGLRSLRVVS